MRCTSQCWPSVRRIIATNVCRLIHGDAVSRKVKGCVSQGTVLYRRRSALRQSASRNHRLRSSDRVAQRVGPVC